MDEDIQKQGARAAAMGAGLLDCPFLRLAQLPCTTNEKLHVWRTKVEAWEAGWNRFRKLRP